MTECKHEYRTEPDTDGIVRCWHCLAELATTPKCINDVADNNPTKGGKRSEAGTKNDGGKPDLSLFPREAIEAASRAFMFGEKKYSRDNWRKGISKERLVAATLRHLFAWKDGELSDPESNLSHLDHAMASLAMLITLHKE